jgi:hypothetical protein
VRSATPGELAEVWRSCQPWPWLLAGTTPVAPPGLTELIGSRPIAVHWVGDPPAGLPGRPVAHPDWMALVAGLEQLRALTDEGVAGVRLLRNRGLLAPDGRIVQGVFNVEGLLAAPAGLVLPPNGGPGHALAAVREEIAANGLPLRVEQAGDLIRLA